MKNLWVNRVVSVLVGIILVLTFNKFTESKPLTSPNTVVEYLENKVNYTDSNKYFVERIKGLEDNLNSLKNTDKGSTKNFTDRYIIYQDSTIYEECINILNIKDSIIFSQEYIMSSKDSLIKIKDRFINEQEGLFASVSDENKKLAENNNQLQQKLIKVKNSRKWILFGGVVAGFLGGVLIK